MYIRNVFQFIVENYNVSEAEAIVVWKKSNWHGLLHPLALLVVIGGCLMRFWFFSGRSDILLYDFISLRDVFLAVVLLLYIFLWNFFRIEFIKNHLRDKKLE